MAVCRENQLFFLGINGRPSQSLSAALRTRLLALIRSLRPGPGRELRITSAAG